MKKISTFLILFLCHLMLFGQTTTKGELWSDVSENDMNLQRSERQIVPQKYRTMSLDLESLKTSLLLAPLERTSNSTQRNQFRLNFPMPDGTSQTFVVMESPIMEDGLAAKFPTFKTYLAKGIDDPTATMRFDLTHKGFHSMMKSASGTVFIDPYSKNNVGEYIVYYKKDFTSDKEFTCHVDEGNLDLPTDNSINRSLLNAFSNGDELRTYRFACAATGEYTAFHGGSVADGQAAIVTTTNRVNTVYENDLAIRLVLVANNDILVFTNGNTDPFNNNNAGQLIGQSQTEIDNRIGNANYDVGHTVSTGGGGLAGLGVPCRAGLKASGITGLPNPVGDPFDIDYVSHEIGHQFAGNHTFNGSSGNCSGGNRNGGTAYEPGSGSTIQAYAGICNPQNLQSNSDAYFHVISLEEMITYSTAGAGNGCPTVTATGNTAPIASAAPMPTGLTIPANTPFELTGQGTDANNDALTYCWEQFDLGAQSAPESPSGNVPLFRSFTPSTNPVRTFPRLTDLVNNTIVYGELLPTYTRSMEFRLTVRDNRAGGGGVHCAPYTLNVNASAGPFVVNAPNTAVQWGTASTQTVTWAVANTDAAPVSCANVDILLSTDGGLTYPVTLASNVPNDGTHDITVPNIVTTTARVKVICSDNIFFDISNTNFEIFAASSDFGLTATSTDLSGCAPNNVTTTINVNGFGGYTDDVILTATGVPTGSSASFSPTTVTGGSGTSTLTLTTSGVAFGTYTVTVEGTGSTGVRTMTITFNVLTGTLAQVTLATPADAATAVVRPVDCTWNMDTNADTYDIDIASDAGFGTIIESATGLTTTNYSAGMLSSSTQYYWRSRAINSCSTGTWSDTRTFTTAEAPACVEAFTTNAGFEDGSGSAPWLQFSSSGFEVIDSGARRTGSFGAWLGGDNNETTIIGRGEMIPVSATSASLNFYYLISSDDNCGSDIGGVFVDDEANGGIQNDEFFPLFDLCADTNMDEFSADAFQYDLSAYIGQNIFVGFYTITNESSVSSFFIDDTSLEICETSALPLEWMSVSANPKGNDIAVQWSTANEYNSKGFEVLRGTELNKGFEKIAWVDPQELSSTYHFLDKEVNANATYYYQIRQVDINNQASLSDIVEASVKVEGTVMNVYPNPTNGQIFVDYISDVERTLEVSVLDALGRVILIQQVAVNQSATTLDLTTLTNGVYFVRMDNGEQIKTERIVMQR